MPFWSNFKIHRDSDFRQKESLKELITSSSIIRKTFGVDTLWQEFKQSKIPIFWIIGPPHSGKTTLAYFLADAANFRLVHSKYLARGQISNAKEPAFKDYIKLLKQEIKTSFKFTAGYIIDDFPTNMSECRKFEKKLCEPTVVIYIYMTLDATLGRILARRPTVDLNDVRVEYVKQANFAEKLYKRYDKVRKVIKVYSQYPIQDAHFKILEMLETEFGYKFKHNYKVTA